jgi:predicted kinase
MKELILGMGIPGAGKSTYLEKHVPFGCVIVSRDAIRFSMVKPDEEYFSKETEVFNAFIAEIVHALEEGYDVYADATHLNAKSRAKVINAVMQRTVPSKISVLWVQVDLEVALAQNELRQGTRAYVPKSAIRRMNEQMRAVDLENENYIDEVIVVKRITRMKGENE